MQKTKTKTKQNKQKGFEKSEMEIVYRHQYRNLFLITQNGFF